MSPAAPRSIILVGMMGSGKTAVGRAVAAATDRVFIDVDAVIESAAGCSIGAVFAGEGEPGFRRRESAAILQVAEAAVRAASVIACGGGAVLDPANTAALREAGLVVWLQVRPEVAARRLASAVGRPVLEAMEGDLVDRLSQLMARRSEAYRMAAHLAMDADGTPEAVAARVQALAEANEAQPGPAQAAQPDPAEPASLDGPSLKVATGGNRR